MFQPMRIEMKHRSTNQGLTISGDKHLESSSSCGSWEGFLAKVVPGWIHPDEDGRKGS